LYIFQTVLVKFSDAGGLVSQLAQNQYLRAASPVACVTDWASWLSVGGAAMDALQLLVSSGNTSCIVLL
jgi:hypothetical protein